MAKTAQATAGQDSAQAGQTMYAQVKANVDKLDKKGKQRILQLLQKSLQQPAAPAAPAAKAAAPAAKAAPAKPAPTKAAPAAKAAPVAPTAEPVAKKKSGSRKAAAPSQAEIDADRNRLMGVTSDSVIRKGAVVAESFSFYRKK